jgi:hypothetical protein
LKIVERRAEGATVYSKRVLITRTHSVSVARSEDQLTEVRWFLSIQFSKSLIPWRAYQSRLFRARSQAFFSPPAGARSPTPTTLGSATIRKCQPAVNPLLRVFFDFLERRRNHPARETKSTAEEEGKKGEEFQGKEGMSWMELSTGWRAPR